jgi:hypothetical protein
MPMLESLKDAKLRFVRTSEIFSLRRALALIGITVAFTAGGGLELRAQDDPVYQGSSGALYRYDLSNPGDQLRYSVDPGAQLRDSVDPRVGIDRSLGQYGGGVER